MGGRPAAREPGTGTRIKARHQGTYLASPAAPPRWVRLSAASHSHGQPGAGQFGRATDGGTSSSPCSMLHAPSTPDRLVAGSEERGQLPSQQARPACVAVSCRALLSVAALKSTAGGQWAAGKVCVIAHLSARCRRRRAVGSCMDEGQPERKRTVGGGGPCTARGLGNGARRWWRYLAALVVPVRTGAPPPATGPGQVPHDMVDAASCLVHGAQQRLGERAASWGPVLNRPLTNLCIFFRSLFLFPILLLPEQISSSPPLPFPYSFLHPQPVIPSPAPSLPTAPPVETRLSRLREKRGKEEI